MQINKDKATRQKITKKLTNKGLVKIKTTILEIKGRPTHTKALPSWGLNWNLKRKKINTPITPKGLDPIKSPFIIWRSNNND